MSRKTTINRHAKTKQVSLLDGTDVPVLKRYVVEGQNYYYHNQMIRLPIKDSVEVYLPVQKRASRGLGYPMPAGVPRVDQQDSKGGVQFVGEDRIIHTPKDETLNMKIGNAFDVICERNQIDFQKIVFERLRDRVRDHAAEPQGSPIGVEVNEPIGGTWRMLNSSHEWTKTSAWAAQFKVRSRRTEGGAEIRVRITY